MKDYFPESHSIMKRIRSEVPSAPEGCPDDLPPPYVIRQRGKADCLHFSILFFDAAVKKFPEIEETAKVFIDYNWGPNMGHGVVAWPVWRLRAFRWLWFVSDEPEQVMIVLDPFKRKPCYKPMQWVEKQERSLTWKALNVIWARNYSNDKELEHHQV